MLSRIVSAVFPSIKKSESIVVKSCSIYAAPRMTNGSSSSAYVACVASLCSSSRSEKVMGLFFDMGKEYLRANDYSTSSFIQQAFAFSLLYRGLRALRIFDFPVGPAEREFRTVPV